MRPLLWKLSPSRPRTSTSKRIPLRQQRRTRRRPRPGQLLQRQCHCPLRLLSLDWGESKAANVVVQQYNPSGVWAGRWLGWWAVCHRVWSSR